jgi:uncharacterized protein
VQFVVVFDTNIWLSARLSSRGSPASCVELARKGEIESVLCREIVDEFERKLVSKFDRMPSTARMAAEEIRRFSRMVEIAGVVAIVLNDPSDNVIVECAVAGGATHIVTGDKKHLLPIGEYEGIRIVTPAEFLALVDEARSGM